MAKNEKEKENENYELDETLELEEEEKEEWYKDERELWIKIEKETIKKVKNRKFFTFTEHVSNWLDKMIKLGPAINFVDPLFKSRGLELFNNLQWIQICVFSGAYHQAIRELRYSLEIMIQAYFLDTKYPQASLETKIAILQALEDFKTYPTGGKVIDATDLDNKEELKALYKDLSGYVHPSPIIEKQLPFPPFAKFDESLFDLCVEFSNKVMEHINKIAKKWKEF